MKLFLYLLAAAFVGYYLANKISASFVGSVIKPL